jgi:hypothetical protein
MSRPLPKSALAERARCSGFIRAKIAETRRMEHRGACDPESADILVHRLAAIADSIDAGLHIPDARG